jgi:predicted transcriptional regulator
MVNNNNYINIQGFMVKDLGLKGNELLAYALIYGFSQDGETWFTGSSKYIAEWLNIDRRNVLAVLQKLVEKGLLIKNEKIINGVKLCNYKAVIGSDETSQGMMNHHRGSDKTSQGGSDETSHHNTSIDNIEDSIYIRKQFKKPSLEDVNLYCKERNNNVDCERFINYYESNGWKVGKSPMKDWKAAVRNWERSSFNQPAQSNEFHGI